MKRPNLYATIVSLLLVLLTSGCLGNAEGYGGHKPPTEGNPSPSQNPSGGEGQGVTGSTPSLEYSWFNLTEKPSSTCVVPKPYPNNAGMLSLASTDTYVFYPDLCSHAVDVKKAELQFSKDNSIVLYKNMILQKSIITNPIKVFCFNKELSKDKSLEIVITKNGSGYEGNAQYTEDTLSDTLKVSVLRSDSPSALEYSANSELILNIPKPFELPNAKATLHLKLHHTSLIDAEMQCRVTDIVLLD